MKAIEVTVNLGGTTWDETFKRGNPGSISITVYGQGTLSFCRFDADLVKRLLERAIEEYDKRFP